MQCNDMLDKHHAYILAYYADMPEVRDRMWSDEARLHGQRSRSESLCAKREKRTAAKGSLVEVKS